MLIADLLSWFDSRTRWEKAALVIWSALLLLVCVRVSVWPASRTVYPIFSASGRFWWTGAELYEPHRPTDVQDGFRYSPTCAILFTPFAFFPDALGGVLWRLFSAAAFLAGLAWFARCLLPSMSAKQFAGLLLLVIPLSMQSINNGQANIIVIACMLAAVAAVHEERWNLVSVFIALAFVCKLYPLALGMILVVLYPRQLAWRIPAACLASLLLPFLCQQPIYVADQYEKWIALLRSEDRVDIDLKHMYRDAWLLIHLYGLPIHRTVYVLLQIAGGAVVALICWRRQRAGWPRAMLLTSTLALATAWMMLLGPATESSSFTLLAPSLAWSIMAALTTPDAVIRRGLLWGTCALFSVAVLVGGLNPSLRIHEAGVHAWASLGYFTYLLSEPHPQNAQTSAVVSERRRLAA